MPWTLGCGIVFSQKKHWKKIKANDALKNSIVQVWGSISGSMTMKIFDLIPTVIHLIIRNNRGNDLVESKRGLVNLPE